jgi:hypothetical protein
MLPFVGLKKPKTNNRTMQKTILLIINTLTKFVFSVFEMETFQKKIKKGIKRSGNNLIHSLTPRDTSFEYNKEIKKYPKYPVNRKTLLILRFVTLGLCFKITCTKKRISSGVE